jgi:magnesium transporter
VLTVRDGSVAGLDDSLRVVRGRTRLGMLDAATFVAVLLDGIVSGYFASTEEVERQIDRIDDVALRSTPDERVLDRLLIVRRRVAVLRRSLVPHRPVIAALARPDLGLRSGEDDPWPALVERVERAIETIENARELLVGSFEIVMTRTGQRTNDIMRTLTVVSVTLLPASLIAAIFGMNFRAELFDVDGLFWPMVGAIGALCGAILLTARLRGWL